MKIKKILLLLILILHIITNTNFAFENKILFKVNNEIITSIDLLNEIEYLKLVNENFDKLE